MKETPELVEYLGEHVILSHEQLALITMVIDLVDGCLLSGTASEGDANRVIALVDTLNQSFAIGYLPNFEPNEFWMEQGRICPYEHCIEQMPLPGSTRAEHEEWRARILDNVSNGMYDEDPDHKAMLMSMVEADDSTDYPETVDHSSSCPMFGHNCPGGPETIKDCEAANEWIEELAARDDSQPG